MKQAVILAGGRGTRLSERLGNLPKPLVDVNGRPLLEYQLDLLQRYGYSDVLILVSYGADQIEAFCAAQQRSEMNVRCLNDGTPRGTAGAVLAIVDQLQEEFLVVYGDTMLDVDLGRFELFHHAGKRAMATLFIHPNDHPHDSDLVEVTETGEIVGFYSKPHSANRFYPNLVNAALYMVRREALQTWQDQSGPLDFGKDLFPKMLELGFILKGYNSPEYIKDCGTPDRLDRVAHDVSSGLVRRRALNVPQRAVFLDRDGVLNVDTPFISCPEQLQLLPGVGQAIKSLNRSEYKTVLITNQPVVARGDCSFEMLRQIHNKLETLLGREGAYLDRIYFCPHHPDGGFRGEVRALKKKCECRKPSTGMVDQAIEDLNIDPAQSWFIGDSTVDTATAHAAGVQSVLVQTGNAGTDGKFSAAPDYTFPHLSAAVDFIASSTRRPVAS